MARTCGKCHKPGHNKATCGKEPKLKSVSTGNRACGNCGLPGHNRATCASESSEYRETLKDQGRRILASERRAVDSVDVQGVTPRKGLWLLNTLRNRIAGQILDVKTNGQILWEDFAGVQVETEQNRLIDSGYQYADDIPVGEWQCLIMGTWQAL